MCDKLSGGLARTNRILLIFSAFLLISGSCENAEPGDTFTGSDLTKNEQRRDDPYDVSTADQQFKWLGSEEDGSSLDEHVAPVSSPHADTNGETKTEIPKSNGNNNNKAEMSELTDSDDVESTRKSFGANSSRCSSERGTKRRLCINESRLKKRRRYTSAGRGAASDSRVEVSNGIRGSSGRNRRIQERGTSRVKNRGRKRNGKRTKLQGNRGRTRSRKNKSDRISVDTLLALHQASNGKIRNSSGSSEGCISKDCSLNETNIESDVKIKDFNAEKDSDNTVLPRITDPPLMLYRRPVENVEHEFSKNLEKEILWSQTEKSYNANDIFSSGRENTKTNSSLISAEFQKTKSSDSDKIINARFDAAKMLGYSRSAEDLPIMDLENEVLARTLKDYNAYLKSGGIPGKLVRHASEWSEKTRNLQEHQKNDPIPARPLHEHDYHENDEGKKKIQQESLTDSDATADLKGDLTCINGTFLPAPLSRHALIKYVKSSIPGHEYLEADYECTPGYYMASSNSRLLCKEHQWVGELPNCKIRRGQSGSCGKSLCDQVCNEVDGEAKCSCYKGFRLDGHKCIDINECESGNGDCEHICVNTPGSYRCECPQGMKQGKDKFTCMDVNECLLNNGHGPCQDTCRNLEGSYVCSCEGLPGTILSPNNHTCQDAGPCAVNNAGCSHTCLSTMGRVFCLCPDGFMLADDWKTCQDVDECSVPDLQTEPCHYGCVNTPGSYRCIDPTELGDQPIQDSLSITCLPGYELSAESNCIDVNECAIDNGECTEVCENTDGSFFCACDGDEKTLSADGKSCTDLNNLTCPPLDPTRRGYLMCSRETTPRLWRDVRRAVNRPGTKCYLKCPTGYQLHGEYELTCQGDGTWDGPKHGECVKYSKPRLECPLDVVTEIPPDRDEAFVTFDQPSTDLDWFRYVRSKPSWGTRLEASLKPGLHLINFFARHPVSKKQASCVLRIIVKDGEAPKVDDCPKDIVGINGTSITWTEPTFTDNVKVTHISKNERPGKSFGIGEWKIVYEASDEAGWTTRCVFSVVVHQN